MIRFSALGDLVLTTPVYRELKRVYPDSEVTLLTSFGFGSILDHNPHIDHVIQHPRKETSTQLKSLINRLKESKFDLIYDVHRSLRSIWIVWNLRWSGSGLFDFPEIWSINKRSWQRSLLIKYKINFLKNSASQRLHWLSPLQKKTDQQLDSKTELFPPPETQSRIQELLTEKQLEVKKFIAIGPSASYALKLWPFEYYQLLIEKLLKEGWKIVLTGGPGEEEPLLLEQQFEGQVVNLAGKLELLESAELLKSALLVVTNDTSIGHLAEAMNTPAFVFFGPTVREFGYPPFLEGSQMLETRESLSCRPCSRDGRGKCRNSAPLQCLTSITPEDVFTKVQQYLHA